MSELIHLTIDGRAVAVPPETTILHAAEGLGLKIPTLCYLPDLMPDGSCRMCVVEAFLPGRPGGKLVTACSEHCQEGMTVYTRSDKVVESRRFVLDLLLSKHDPRCNTCPQNGRCLLSDYCYEYGVDKTSYEGERPHLPIDDSNPFLTYDPNQCINCRRCVRTCGSLVGINMISISGRGFYAQMSTPYAKPWDATICNSCGNCVSVCPVAALTAKKQENLRTQPCHTHLVRTTCSSCGVGCQMDLVIRDRDGKLVGAEPAYGRSNHGLLCHKGKFGSTAVHDSSRLTSPMVRKDGVLTPVSWDEALTYTAERMQGILTDSGPDAFAGLASARCTNEANYVFQKLMRAVIGTNNVDHCARLFHSSAVGGLVTTMGLGAMTNSIEEAAGGGTCFVLGSDLSETLPVMGMQILQGLRRGGKLIVADSRDVEVGNKAHLRLKPLPHTAVPLLNGMMHVILSEHLEDRAFINARTENIEDLEAAVALFTPEYAASLCGVPAEDIAAAARLYAASPRAAVYYGLNLPQNPLGTAAVSSVCNLALLCGKVGKPGCGVNPLRGQNNVQGACDMGCEPTELPGYQKIFDLATRRKFEKAWGCKLRNSRGLYASEVMDAIMEGQVRCLYVMGENPRVSNNDRVLVESALHRCDMLIVQDVTMTETAELADVVLPAATFAEQDGTYTNTERRVQLVREARPPLGDSRADWCILSDLMERFGYRNSFRSSREIMDEIADLTPLYGGIRHPRLEECGSLQWPCPNADHPGTPILYTESFFHREKAVFKPER